jgi:hypothetical protein
MNLKYVSPLYGIMVFILCGCSWNNETITGDGQVSREERPVGNFEELSVAGSMDVYLSDGPVKDAIIEAESNLIPYLEFISNGKKLKVKFRDNVKINNKEAVNVYLATPDVQKISMVGSGQIVSQDTLASDHELSVHAVGSGNVHLMIDAPELSAELTGSGDMHLSGRVDKADINLMGSGDYNAKELISMENDVNIVGSGDAWLQGGDKLDVSILGSGDVHYSGNPVIESSILGSGELVQDK